MITLTTVSAWLASPIVGFFAKWLVDYLGQRRAQNIADANAKQAGASSATSQVNKASANAEDRANKVAVNRPGTNAVVDGMFKGDEF